jgi:hypothetical protein
MKSGHEGTHVLPAVQKAQLEEIAALYGLGINVRPYLKNNQSK